MRNEAIAMPERSKHAKGQNINDGDSATPASECVSPLHTIPGFSSLSRRKLYPKGSVLMVEGLKARGVYVLCAGHAKLSITSAEGRSFIVRLARPGNLLGLQATLVAKPYEATVETLTPCQVDFISRKDLLFLLGRHNSYDLSLVITVGTDFTEFIEHARAQLFSVSIHQRLAHLLVRLGDELGEPTRAGIRLNSLLTHEDFAQMIGSSRETVTRSLSMLKRKRIILADKRGLVIKNRAALMALR